MLEDVALMRALPNMQVLNPCDAEEARKATRAAIASGKPAYIRFGRANVPTFTTLETPFTIGKGIILYESEAPALALLSTGSLAFEVLKTAEMLSKEGVAVTVAHFGTVKPLDTALILSLAKKAKRVMTVEEHQIAGGFGSAVAEVLSEHFPVPLKRLGIVDEFGQSGEPSELLAHYGLSAEKIATSARVFSKVY